jgi:hypothetical protein
MSRRSRMARGHSTDRPRNFARLGAGSSSPRFRRGRLRSFAVARDRLASGIGPEGEHRPRRGWPRALRRSGDRPPSAMWCGRSGGARSGAGAVTLPSARPVGSASVGGGHRHRQVGEPLAARRRGTGGKRDRVCRADRNAGRFAPGCDRASHHCLRPSPAARWAGSPAPRVVIPPVHGRTGAWEAALRDVRDPGPLQGTTLRQRTRRWRKDAGHAHRIPMLRGEANEENGPLPVPSSARVAADPPSSGRASGAVIRKVHRTGHRGGAAGDLRLAGSSRYESPREGVHPAAARRQSTRIHGGGVPAFLPGTRHRLRSRSPPAAILPCPDAASASDTPISRSRQTAGNRPGRCCMPR